MRADVLFLKHSARIHFHSIFHRFLNASCSQTALATPSCLLPAVVRHSTFKPCPTALHTSLRELAPSTQQRPLSSLRDYHQSQAGCPSLVQQRLQRRSFTASAYVFKMAKRDDMSSVPVSASPMASSTSSSSKHGKSSSRMSPKVRTGPMMDPSSPVQAFVPTLGSPSARGFGLARVPSVHSPGGGLRSVGGHPLSDSASAKGKRRQSSRFFSINMSLNNDTSFFQLGLNWKLKKVHRHGRPRKALTPYHRIEGFITGCHRWKRWTSSSLSRLITYCRCCRI